MPLVTSYEIFKKARKEKFAIGAFNANNMEMVSAIIEVAEEEKAPVFLQISQGAIKYAGLEMATAMVRTAAELASVPVILHLDHGTDYYQNIKCLRIGFTSLMFDGSALQFEKNVEITQKIVDMAHACGLPVEAELGKVPGTEDKLTPQDVEGLKTDIDEAKRFYELTKCDSLAISVGSVHRMKTSEAKLDIKRIKEINAVVQIPLVLHGASGVAYDSIKEAIQNGVCKVNVATQLNLAFIRGTAEVIKSKPDESDIRKILIKGKEATKEVIRKYIQLFGSSGKGVLENTKSQIEKGEVKHAE